MLHHPSRPARIRLSVALVLSVVVLACAGGPEAGESPASGAGDGMSTDPDLRTSVVLPPMGRHMVLSEMRLMLGSVQGYIAAAARGDTAGMRAAASASGMAAARDMDPAMEQRLPAEFLALGMSTHAAWDSLATDVSRGLPADQTLERLGKIMSNCVSCHNQFRIDLQR